MFVLRSADSVIVEVLFPLSLLSSIGILFFYIKFRAVREQPGDILLALSIGSVFLLVSYFATASTITILRSLQQPISRGIVSSRQLLGLLPYYWLLLCAVVLLHHRLQCHLLCVLHCADQEHTQMYCV